MSGPRFARSTREAFACERYPAVFGPYRQEAWRLRAVGWVVTLGLFALLGVLLAWRG